MIIHSNVSSQKYILVDPRSYHNLALYDYQFLESLSAQLPSYQFYLLGSVYYTLPLNDYFTFLPFYCYNKKRFLPFKVFLYVINSFRLFCFILSSNPAVIHFQWFLFPPVDFLIVVLIRFFTKARLICTIHNIPRSTNRFYLLYYRLFYSLFHHFVFHTPLSQRRFQALHFRSQISDLILNHGTLDLSLSPSPITDPESKFLLSLKQLRSLTSYPIFCFVGSQSVNKGFDILLESISLIPHSDRPHFVFVGKPSNLFKDHIVLKDPIAHNLLCFDSEFTDRFLSEVYSLVDFVLLPHRLISTSGVLMSSLSSATPYILSSSTYNDMTSLPFIDSISVKFDSSSLSLSQALLKIKNTFSPNQFDCFDSIIYYYSWPECIKRSGLISLLHSI